MAVPRGRLDGLAAPVVALSVLLAAGCASHKQASSSWTVQLTNDRSVTVGNGATAMNAAPNRCTKSGAVAPAGTTPADGDIGDDVAVCWPWLAGALAATPHCRHNGHAPLALVGRRVSTRNRSPVVAACEAARPAVSSLGLKEDRRE